MRSTHFYLFLHSFIPRSGYRSPDREWGRTASRAKVSANIMARSEAAIHRRAEKRQKSAAEQRKADFADAQRCKERQEARDRGAPIPDAAALSRTPAAATSSTCSTTTAPHAAGKPTNRRTVLVTPPRQKKKNGVKHNIKRSAGGKKKEQAIPAKWARQASQEQIERNAALRTQYSETNGEGMSEEDAQRAKALILRDERKRAKKAERAKRKMKSAAAPKTSTKDTKKQNTKKEKPESATETKTDMKEDPESVADTSDQKEEKERQPQIESASDTGDDNLLKTAPQQERQPQINPPLHPRPKKPTPIDMAWRQVAIDEREGRIPEFKAETETEMKLERIAERNRKSRAELVKIRALLAGDSQDVDAGLEAVGRYASRSTLSSLQDRREEIVGTMKKILKKRGKKTHKKSMRYKNLTGKVQRRLKISAVQHADLKQILKQIGEEMEEFQVGGDKTISLK